MSKNVKSAGEAVVAASNAPTNGSPGSGANGIEHALKVRILPQLGVWEYEGSRAQLEAECVIPPDLEWPTGTESQAFDDGRLGYSLRRCRPDGVKGPMKVWTSGDWWSLRCTLFGGTDFAALDIAEKKRALDAVLHRNSPAGRHELDATWERHRKALHDKAFQAFKDILVPTPKRPGRKMSEVTRGGEAS